MNSRGASCVPFAGIRVNVKLIGSSVGDGPPQQFLTSFLVNDSVAIDAGSLGLLTPIEVQRQVRNVFITHSHIDHVATLPIFLDNVYPSKTHTVSIYASEHTLDCLRQFVFNDRLWPDVERLPTGDIPFVRFVTLSDRKELCIDGLRIVPVELDHVVPCFGFIIVGDTAAVAIVTDTGPTDTIWQVAREISNFQAVFLEVGFPNSLQWLADQSKHLTPETFQAESNKLGHDVHRIAVHLKSQHRRQITEQLNALNLPNLQIAQPGQTYTFPK